MTVAVGFVLEIFPAVDISIHEVLEPFAVAQEADLPPRSNCYLLGQIAAIYRVVLDQQIGLNVEQIHLQELLDPIVGKEVIFG